MRSRAEYERVLDWLRSGGMGDQELSRISGIPRSTIRYWRLGKRQPEFALSPCPLGADTSLDPAAYAYLLGLYLGDGYISRVGGKRVFKIRITLDVRYPGIVESCARAIERVRGRVPYRLARKGCWEVASYWKHWPCLFPQHGPGRKHQRTIRLAGWQTEVVKTHSGELLRGLIHSDGCRAPNRVVVRGKAYVYPRYQFKNLSDDVRAIFCNACDDFGVRWTRAGRTTIAVSRAADVARLDRVVGPKA